MLGVFLVFFQVIIGGITRLTDSGLSITEWAVIQGTIPPMNELEWEHERQEYMEHAIGQVKMKWSGTAYPNGIPMSEFKFIYFWEYFHRLWARSIGLIFLFPFLFFIYKRKIHKNLIMNLLKVVFLAAIVATFGWIMVKSGLNTPEYAWVNGYKLTIHLSLATLLLSYLWWITLHEYYPFEKTNRISTINRFSWFVTCIVFLQILFGGLMAGTKAGLTFNHFPHMQLAENGSMVWIADVLKDPNAWSMKNLMAYNQHPFALALIQIVHRSTAYILCILIPLLAFKIVRSKTDQLLSSGAYSILVVLTIQIVLGICTLLFAIGQIPLFYGVAHQGFGLILLLNMLFINHAMVYKKNEEIELS